MKRQGMKRQGMNRQLLRQTLLGTAPLLVWAAHFTFCYVLVGAQCSPALFDAAAPRSVMLLAVSALALVLCGWLLWRAARGVQLAQLAGAEDALALRQWASLAGAVLALAGVAWTSMPLLMLDGCG